MLLLIKLTPQWSIDLYQIQNKAQQQQLFCDYLNTILKLASRLLNSFFVQARVSMLTTDIVESIQKQSGFCWRHPHGSHP